MSAPRLLAAAASAFVFTSCAVAQVGNGIDTLRADGFRSLAGQKVGLITNASGIARDRTPTIDLLHGAPGVELRALFGPEHGLRGDLDTDTIADGTDARTGLPVFSLYNGPQKAPADGAVAGLDTLVFDIQDVGARFYTYISTMGLAMEVAARNGVRFVVLDRVNPVGAGWFEGPLRDGPRVFVAHHPLPIVHGMTVGEVARLYRSEIPALADLELEVVPVSGWKRSMRFDQTGLPWVNPSPNMRSLDAALLYPGVALLEFTNVSVGRGTATPFEHMGAPFIDGEALAAKLAPLGLPGVRITPTSFTPEANTFAGERCGGLRFEVTDPDGFRPVAFGVALCWAIDQLYGETFNSGKIATLLLHPPTLAAIRADAPPTGLHEGLWSADHAAFGRRRSAHLLYP